MPNGDEDRDLQRPSTPEFARRPKKRFESIKVISAAPGDLQNDVQDWLDDTDEAEQVEILHREHLIDDSGDTAEIHAIFYYTEG